MRQGLRIVAPGLLSTIQDAGRVGCQHLGVSPSGALDRVALQAANALAGNAPDEAAIEMMYGGASFAVEADSVRIAFAGAAARVEIAETAATHPQVIAPMRSITLRRGATVRSGALREGAVAYLAVEGGFALAPVLGSRATDRRSGLGGLDGRALATGDLVPLRRPSASERGEATLPLRLDVPRRLRVMPGPQRDHFSNAEYDTFLAATFSVGANSSRMALRLEGHAVAHGKSPNIVSDATAAGSVQIPGDGQPIVLLADRQTTGGYPKIATVISADIAALGRLPAGARIGFAQVSLDEALAARRAFLAGLESLPARLLPLRETDMSARLYDSNLISGVFDAAA